MSVVTCTPRYENRGRSSPTVIGAAVPCCNRSGPDILAAPRPWIPAFAGKTKRGLAGLFSYQSLMSVVTCTPRYENRGRSSPTVIGAAVPCCNRSGPDILAAPRPWIPAFAGKTKRGLAGLFSYQSLMLVVTCTPRYENRGGGLADESSVVIGAASPCGDKRNLSYQSVFAWPRAPGFRLGGRKDEGPLDGRLTKRGLAGLFSYQSLIVGCHLHTKVCQIGGRAR